MIQSIVHIALVVKDYDEAITFYTEKLNFTVIEDTYQPEQDKRWVVISRLVQPGQRYCSREHPNLNKNRLSATRLEAGCFCF